MKGRCKYKSKQKPTKHEQNGDHWDALCVQFSFSKIPNVFCWCIGLMEVHGIWL